MPVERRSAAWADVGIIRAVIGARSAKPEAVFELHVMCSVSDRVSPQLSHPNGSKVAISSLCSKSNLVCENSFDVEDCFGRMFLAEDVDE